MQNKTRNILSISFGGLISLIFCIGIISVVMFIYLIHLSYEPIQYLQDYLKFYILPVGLLIIVVGSFLLFRRKKKYFAHGILIGLIPILFLLYLNTADLIGYFKPIEFSIEGWRLSEEKPYTLARGLIKDDLIKDKSYSEVLEYLGDDYVKEYSNDSTIVYRIDIARFTYLKIDFNKEKIMKKVDFIYWD